MRSEKEAVRNGYGGQAMPAPRRFSPFISTGARGQRGRAKGVQPARALRLRPMPQGSHGLGAAPRPARTPAWPPHQWPAPTAGRAILRRAQDGGGKAQDRPGRSRHRPAAPAAWGGTVARVPTAAGRPPPPRRSVSAVLAHGAHAAWSTTLSALNTLAPPPPARRQGSACGSRGQIAGGGRARPPSDAARLPGKREAGRGISSRGRPSRRGRIIASRIWDPAAPAPPR